MCFFFKKINLDISNFTSIFNHPYEKSKNSVGQPSYKQLSNVEKFGQLVKAISLFSLGILSLGTLFISVTVRTNIQTWWNECKTGKRKIQIIKDVKTQYASIRKADKISKKNLKKPEKILDASKSKNIEQNSMVDLPDDVLILLFQELDFKDWESLSQTNERLHALSVAPPVLARLVERRVVPKDKLVEFAKIAGGDLTTLDLHKYCKLSEQELIEIFKSCPNLKKVNLNSRDLTDLTCKSLPRSLQSLKLSGCKEITDSGLTYLKELKALQSSKLSSTRITDAGLALIKELKTLLYLDLILCNGITDTGLAHVKEFEALRSLLLGNCNKITDFGLAHLKEVKSLQYLGLGNCKGITSAGIKNFKQSRNSLYPIIQR